MPILQISKLKKSYVQAGKHIPVLQGLSLEAGEGETLAILGQSGSGKSTLLTLMAGLDQADSGKILVRNKDIGSLSPGQLADFRGRHIGIVFQHFHLMSHLSTLENVCLPLNIRGGNSPEKQAKKLLEDVGLKDREVHFPAQLSGGEQQRVAIARALITKPDILLADEPSGNLDSVTGSQVMDQIFSAVSGLRMSLILVTHNPELAARCDRQLELKEGVLL